jgi:hypothetical protein
MGITSFVSPGHVYCFRSVCYLPKGLSVECLNLQAPTFFRTLVPQPPFLRDPTVVVVPEGHLNSFQVVPRTLRTLSWTAFQSQDRSVTSINSTVL